MHPSTTTSGFRAPSKRLAFTLIEILVVIAIVAVLASLLFPALRGVMDRSKTAKCTANLKTIVSGFLLYANDHNGTMPYNKHTGNVEHWYLPSQVGKYIGVNPKGGAGNSISVRPLRCPSALPWNTSGAPSFTFGVNYTGVPRANIYNPVVIGDEPYGAKISSLSGGTMLLADSDASVINNPYRWPMGSTEGGEFNRAVFRHGQFMQAGCVDGSVKAITKKAWLENENGIWGPPQ